MPAGSSTGTCVSPIGIAVTGLRDANIYGYSAYRGQDPTLDVDFGASAAPTVQSGGLRLWSGWRSARDGCH